MRLRCVAPDLSVGSCATPQQQNLQSALMPTLDPMFDSLRTDVRGRTSCEASACSNKKLAARDIHFQSRRPVLVFVGVVQVRAAGGAGIGAGNCGDQAQRKIEIVCWP